MTQLSADSGLNAEKFTELQDILEDALQDVIETYLRDSTVRLDELREAHAAGDPLRLAKVAHTLKGSSLNIGADDLGQLCSALDLDCRGGTLVADAGERIESIAQEYARVASALRVYL